MKNIFKMPFAVVAFAAVGLASYQAYGSYTAANMSEEDLLLAENIEAISQMIESSPTTYRVIGVRKPCYGPQEELMECSGSKEEHMDTYLRSYDKKGEHYKCESRTFILSPWASKPADECYSDKNCESGTVPENKVPREYKGGNTVETYKEHK